MVKRQLPDPAELLELQLERGDERGRIVEGAVLALEREEPVQALLGGLEVGRDLGRRPEALERGGDAREDGGEVGGVGHGGFCPRLRLAAAGRAGRARVRRL